AETGVGLEGRFRAWHVHPEYGLLWEVDLPNGTTTQGANSLLELAFRGGVGIPTWRIGVIAEAGFTGVSTSDTYASHAGWSEFLGAYTKRPLWSANPAQGGRIDSAGVVRMPVFAAGTVRGVFLCDRLPPGDTDPSGRLYATAVAAAGLAVVSGGTIYVTYTLRSRPVS
ncbi:MAG TPA: hypothetical protein VFG68_22980, partial [Fimbriiglobus sp.]|nr:hypothetical protein [Fimbriiglobus sp.]